MWQHILPETWQRNRRWLRLVELGVLFLMLLLAIWLATQQEGAPQLILLLLLYIITVNFSLPPVQGAIGLVPIVAVTSFLVLGLETAVPLAVVSLVVAELARPLWTPMWENIDVQRPAWHERIVTDLINVVALFVGGYLYQQQGGPVPPLVSSTRSLASFALLAAAYGAVYFVLTLLWWRVRRRPWRPFFSQYALAVLTVSLFAQPFALFGGAVFALGGLPVFVIFGLSLMFVSVLVWLTWQRRYVLEQHLTQFASLNSVGASLRETLDLREVLRRTYRKAADLVPADRYTLALIDENGRWWEPVHLSDGHGTTTVELGGRTLRPDDFTCWVAENGRMLELNSRNMHFAARHGLTPPLPLPGAWLGTPLQTAERTIGVLVMQRFAPGQPFSRWSREVLLALAGQASAAIQNARLYSETLRLYNLTDEALAQRVKQLQALLNTMQEGVLMLDTNGRIVLVNTMAARLLGRPAEELRNQRLEPQTAAAALGYEKGELSGLLVLLRVGQAPESLRITFPTSLPGDHGSATRRYLERTEAPVVAERGQTVGWLMLFRDVTEEYELAERRNDLTRMIVHDLRNPVTTFISNMNLVAAMLPDDDGAAAVREAVTDARQSSYDMLDMVDSLMDVNRMEAGQLVIEDDAVNLEMLVARVVGRLRVLADQRKISLTYRAEEELPLVWVDEDIIRRVLVNLIDNALKFTPEGGQVQCEMRAERPFSPQHEPGARCVISDSGPGIPPEHQAQIFDRFMRTNRGGAQVRGTGLGLTFCKLAVEAHNGRIWVEDRPAGGSRFIFTLPGVPILEDEPLERGN